MATPYTTIANRTVVNKILQHEVRLGSFITQFIGAAERTKGTYGGQTKWKMAGTPINEFRDFAFTGRNQMIIPVLGRLKGGYGQNGKQTVAGNETKPDWYWQSLYINMKRKGVEFEDFVDKNKTDWAATASDYKKTLADWWADYQDHDFARTIYEGFSKHVTDPIGGGGDEEGGLGVAKRYNKNFWVWNGETVPTSNFSLNSPTFDFDPATYAANIVTSLSALTSDDYMTSRTLEGIIARLPSARIAPWEKDGEEVYPLIIHSHQATTLRQDAVWLNAQGRYNGKGAMFKNEIGRWGALVIIVNDKIARIPYYEATDTINFFDYTQGVDNSADNQYSLAQLPGANQNGACAILLGRSAVNLGIYEDLEFTPKETEDYGMVDGAAGMKFYGMARNDSYNEFLPDGVAPSDQLPPQSAVIVTSVS